MIISITTFAIKLKLYNNKINLVACDLIWSRPISAFMPRQQPKFTKLKYFVTLTCSHGGVKVKMMYMYMLQIYIFHSIDLYQQTQTTTRQTSKFTKSKYFVTLTCSHGGVKVKMRCTLPIYHHWRNRSSSFGGEANTNYYPSTKTTCDERTEGRTNGWKDGRTR